MNEFDKKLLKFLEERPSIAVQKLEVEGGFSYTSIAKVVSGSQAFPKKYYAKMEELFRKYGWMDPELR